MERLGALRVFVTVAEHLSFSEAARRLHLSPTRVSRIVADLEASLGGPLFVRTTRMVRMTEKGAEFFRRCRVGLGEIDGAVAFMRDENDVPGGALTVTAPVLFGRYHVMPIVTELLERYPSLSIRLLLCNRVTQIVDEEIDIAVRIGIVRDTRLIQHQVGSVERVYTASPAYLGRYGMPQSLSELRRHRVIAIENDLRERAGGVSSILARGLVMPRLVVTDVEAGIEAALDGHGIVSTLSYQVAGLLAEGRLERIPLEDRPEPLPVSILFRNTTRNAPNIRAFVDLARDRLRHFGRMETRVEPRVETRTD
ncbi:LysR family transcriptional regulator [Swaminathania salitolerans]|uniref:LysR family transcriptional regulator n=1 Tax=Swaminathania salitolerans TaxID=182838 RepID=A0A511BKF8_9PROT|nr:LysR family transcriptional regulator [Swaminathania salitolerans]GBQ09785.1 LysR family transcriptional regulator [Swaminathania salitolerans LMG 21291]GEL00850.1 LysR family transcriptional regulator [Swaminathania salitolerans]